MGRTRREPETDTTGEIDTGEGPETYEQFVTRTAEMLDDTRDALIAAAEALLIRGTWREWCDSAPVGVTVGFSEQALRAAPDERVKALVSLADEIEKTIGTLREESAES